MLCHFFGKTRQAWYKARTKQVLKEMEEMLVVDHVKYTRKFLPRIGGRKMHYIFGGFFTKNNIKMGRDKFFDLLRWNGLLLRKKKRSKRTTNSNHSFRKHPNLVKTLTPTRPKQLAGSSVNLVHHSDRGVQYCCKAYIELLVKNNIQISMTEQYDPYENAMAERINRTIKEEFLAQDVFFNYQGALKATKKAIKMYNGLRPHSSVDYMTPDEAHNQTGEIKKRWKNRSNKQMQKIRKLKDSSGQDIRA